MITCDHRPRVELLDEKAGKYAFTWLGYDGKEKTVIFRRGDVIDVIVSASVSKKPGGRNWISFADESDYVQIDPGQTVRVALLSPGPPGLVQCRATAETVLEGC